MNLLLGSSSPMQAKILSGAGFQFRTINPRIDEARVGSGIKNPNMLAQRLVYAKTQAILMRKPPGRYLVTTATVASCDGQVLGIPKDADEATSWLLHYREYPPTFYTIVVAVDIVAKKEAVDIDHTCILFSQISSRSIKAAIARGTIMQQPGAIDLEDPDLKPCIQSINGDPNGLHGMPAEKVKMLLAALDYQP